MVRFWARDIASFSKFPYHKIENGIISFLVRVHHLFILMVIKKYIRSKQWRNCMYTIFFK